MAHLLTTREMQGIPAHTVIDGDGYSPGQMRRLFALGLVKRCTLLNLRQAAQARGDIKGWQLMKAETLIERLSNGNH